MVSYQVNGIELGISGHPEVYPPGDDSFLMLGAVEKARGRVLDIGTGSGYAAAIYAHLAARVVSIERIHDLAESARRVLAELGYGSVLVVEGDGAKGYPPEASYHGISVAAAALDVPRPLLEQLADGGRLVMPLGDAYYQELVRVARRGRRFDRERLGHVAFVPLIAGPDAEHGDG